MDYIELMNAYREMCNEMRNLNSNNCDHCTIGRTKHVFMDCRDFISHHPEEAQQAIMEWLDQKGELPTNEEVFKNTFGFEPRQLDDDPCGLITCPDGITSCNECKFRDFWKQPFNYHSKKDDTEVTNPYKRVCTAPELTVQQSDEISCFLAGGITNCTEWQDIVIERLLERPYTSKIVLYNPRRKHFDVTDPNASRKQIEWEFGALEHMDIFSMYFDNSESPQPICFYELGRHLVKMKERFPYSYKDRIVISVAKGFSRIQDVVIQTQLALGPDYTVNIVNSPEEHADKIYYAIMHN